MSTFHFRGDNIQLPMEYDWIVDYQMFSHAPSSTHLCPWYLLRSCEFIDLNSIWKERNERMVCFARRQDNDDMACFLVNTNVVANIYRVHGWTKSDGNFFTDGYTIINEYKSLWDWIKDCINDVQVCCENSQ